MLRNRDDARTGADSINTDQVGGAGDTTGGTTGGTTTGGAGSGLLIAGGQTILSAGGGNDVSNLGQYTGKAVNGRSAPVQSVVADEGFWVGTSAEDRVFVHLIAGGESGPQVDAGDKVSFTGTMQQNPGDVETTFGVTPEEGADLLEEQGSHVEVRTDDLRVG